MYQSHVPEEARRWPERQRLIRDRIMLADADIVCIQEAAGDTFDTDFDFMRALGYEAVLHKKFRFRCATFYRPALFTLLSVSHEDRALVTAFTSSGPGGEGERPPLYVANAHLSGGAAPDRRLRQVHGVTERIRKWVNAAAAKPKPRLQGRRGSAARRAQEAEARAASASAGAGAGAGAGAAPTGPPPPPPPLPQPSCIIAGDFNSDGNTAVRRLLIEGAVDPDWREPQYGAVELTSRPRGHELGALSDAGEVAYGQNVCDGDWGDWGMRTGYDRYRARRPATYVVPSLASVFLQRTPTSSATHRQQVVADHAVLERLTRHRNNDIEQQQRMPPQRELSAEDRKLCDEGSGGGEEFVMACRRAFDAIDEDRGGSLSAAELRSALDSLAVRGASGEAASAADADAMLRAADADDDGEVDFAEFVGMVRAGGGGEAGERGLRSDWWGRFLRSLRGAAEGSGGGDDDQPELVRLETEADVERLIERFTPAFRAALDALFDRIAEKPPAAAGAAVSESAALAWLELVNRELGRGGTYRGVMAALERSEQESESGRRELTRRAWYGVFARELGEGKWWQVAYGLDVSGVAVEDFEFVCVDAEGEGEGEGVGEGVAEGASGDQEAQQRAALRRRAPRRHYEGWLDYIYFSSGSLRLRGYQESLTEEQARRIYQDGDALPNEWHPSDHLPIGCVFEWT